MSLELSPHRFGASVQAAKLGFIGLVEEPILPQIVPQIPNSLPKVESMPRKRKTEAAAGLDEVDRTMYSTFCNTANSLSQLYTQAVNQQKASFQAGEHHALEGVYQWILRQHEEGSRVTAADIVAHIQNEIDHGVEDAVVLQRLQSQYQHPQTSPPFATAGPQTSSAPDDQAPSGLTSRTGHSDQIRNSVFSNALSSPVRSSLQPYHLAQEGSYPTGGNAARSHDSSMDMHSDSSTNEHY